MTIFRLSERNIFPPPGLADPDGLIAVGGDLSSDRLLLAYRSGIFPWYSEGSPILWWSPDPRLVLCPDRLRVSRSLLKVIRQGRFEISADRDFDGVIRRCAVNPRPGRESTWITEEMIRAYSTLHRKGYAHSIECRREGRLVGGLYGVSLGRMFFGESMFSLESNSSKVALASLSRTLIAWKFDLIDCQMRSDHLVGLGAVEISRAEFLARLSQSLRAPDRTGKWDLEA